MTLKHAWHDFTNSVTVQLGRLHSQTFTNSHFHFLVAVDAALAAPSNGMAQRVILQHDSTIPHSAPTRDSFSSAVHFNSVVSSNVQALQHRCLLQSQHKDTNTAQKQYEYKKNTVNKTKQKQYGRKTSV